LGGAIGGDYFSPHRRSELDAATASYRRSLELFDSKQFSLLPDVHVARYQTLLSLSDVLKQGDQLAEAASPLDRAIEIAGTEAKKSDQWRPWLAIALLGRGDLHLKLGQEDKATLRNTNSIKRECRGSTDCSRNSNSHADEIAANRVNRREEAGGASRMRRSITRKSRECCER
jgi:hypothetical protein